MIVIQLTLLVALQAHPAPAVTVTLPVAAAGVVRFDAVGEMVTPQGEPACVTVKVWLPMSIVPMRVVGPVFAATL